MSPNFFEYRFGTRQDGDWLESTACTTIRQVHSDQVIEATGPGVAGEGDALVTNRPGLWVAIRTADCVPILLADSRKRVVAAVHAGWRGTSAGILTRTLEKMAHWCATDPADVHVAMGPAILSCCYEVGEEVAAQFGQVGRCHIDLIGENRQQAVAAGVRSQNIQSLGLCTSCDLGSFYSFRKEGEAAGRMISAIRIRA